MNIQIPESDGRRGRFLLERTRATSDYDFEVEICPNPRCPCEVVTLNCFSRCPEDGNAACADGIPLDLRLKNERVLGGKSAADGASARKLARVFAREMLPEFWSDFQRLYLETKLFQTETADLDKIDPWFSPEVEFDGAMAGYYEIFPYAREIRIRAGNREWIFDDRYCVQLDCGCHKAFFSFFEPGASRLADSPARTVGYNLRSGIFEPDGDLAGEAPTFEEITRALLLAIPDFSAFASERQKQLHHLFRRHVGKPPATTVRRNAPKVGRNDPCPCGSGKKFKKCCGE